MNDPADIYLYSNTIAISIFICFGFLRMPFFCPLLVVVWLETEIVVSPSVTLSICLFSTVESVNVVYHQVWENACSGMILVLLFSHLW